MQLVDAIRNADGTITIPRRAEGPGGIVGDAMVTIGPDDPEYAVWDEWLKGRDQT
ncbi:hypothetical protein ACFFV7_50995 [Nonomuraea spiralis]|uniref:Uncharacterized protein n=1 Tax=Nonomuraea spiralis TaxID=46182 RepID=A0ABV5IYE8_9ACTN|nr:hypothetical protein [Nonomuraea spiralis]GGS88444.1 hypothetical protein GCM10010176_035270 [Nonomuraea spiralis]